MPECGVTYRNSLDGTPWSKCLRIAYRKIATACTRCGRAGEVWVCEHCRPGHLAGGLCGDDTGNGICMAPLLIYANRKEEE